MRVRVVVAGGGGEGRVDTGLAVVRELQTLSVEVHWLGLRASLEQERIAPREGALGRAGGRRPVATVHLLRTLPASLMTAFRTLLALEPAAVLCVGGQVSLAAALAAGLLGVPWVLQEHNCRPDWGSRLLAPWADLICCGFADAVRALPSLSAEWTGTPVRPQFFAVPPIEPRNPPRLLVLGGDEGSLLLNRTVPRALALLRAEGLAPSVCHQAGARWAEVVRSSYHDLGLEATVEGVLTEPWRVLAEADLVLARSGATTVAELTAAGRGAVLIPLATVPGNHQEHNARSLERSGGAVVITEGQAEPRTVAGVLGSLLGDRERLRALASSSRAVALPEAARRIARRLLEVGGIA